MNVGGNCLRKVQMSPFSNILVYSIKCYNFFQSSALRYTNFKLKHAWCFFPVLHHFARSKLKLIETDLSFPLTF